MNTTIMTIAGLPIVVEYEYEEVNDVFGTGDSPTEHYIDVISVRLSDSIHNIYDLFEPWMDEIEDIILAECTL